MGVDPQGPGAVPSAWESDRTTPPEGLTCWFDCPLLTVTDPWSPGLMARQWPGDLVSSDTGRPTATSLPVAILTLKCQQLASSSRSQVAVRTTSAASCLTCEPSSVHVRWRPPLSVAIVTQLVTQSLARPVLPRAIGGVISCEDQEQT